MDEFTLPESEQDQDTTPRDDTPPTRRYVVAALPLEFGTLRFEAGDVVDPGVIPEGLLDFLLKNGHLREE